MHMYIETAGAVVFMVFIGPAAGTGILLDLLSCVNFRSASSSVALLPGCLLAQYIHCMV